MMKIARLSAPALLLLAGCIQVVNPVANLLATGTANVNTSVAVSGATSAAPATGVASPVVGPTATPTPLISLDPFFNGPGSWGTPTPVPTPTPRIVVVIETPAPIFTPVVATPAPAPTPTATPTPVPQVSQAPIVISETSVPAVEWKPYGPYQMATGTRTSAVTTTSKPPIFPFAHTDLDVYLVPRTQEVDDSIRRDNDGNDSQALLYRNGVASNLWTEPGSINLQGITGGWTGGGGNASFTITTAGSYYVVFSGNGWSAWSITIQ